MHSDSLVGSLCREVEHMRSRSKGIHIALEKAMNKLLRLRQEKELRNLEQRRKEIYNQAKWISGLNHKKSISMNFLEEISSRNLISQKVLS